MKCKKGYYLSGYDNNSKCVKCLSTCEECESLNICTKCKDGLILNKDSCATCLSIYEGCEKCSDKCDKCYNNKIFKYELNNDYKCIKKEEENNKNKIIQTNLKFERFDSYEKEDNKVNFKPHFILLDNFLYNTTLHLTIIIQIKVIKYENNNLLRNLQDSNQKEEKEIICSQYGDALGNNNKGGYLANFKCAIDLDEEQELLSIEPTKMQIKDKENKIIQSFKSGKKVLNVSELDIISLDEEYENYKFNKISIKNISNIELEDKDKLSFIILGNLDTKIENKIEYDIQIKDNNNKVINATCTFESTNDLDNQVISCNSLIDKKSKKLTFENGIYTSKTDNDNKLILSISKDENIEIPETKNKLIWLLIVGLFLIALILFFKCGGKERCLKKDNKENQNKNKNNKKGRKITDNSKDIILIK